MAEWTEAEQRRGLTLQAELDKPTVSRSLETQTQLLNEIKAAGDQCHSLLVALRSHRKK